MTWVTFTYRRSRLLAQLTNHLRQLHPLRHNLSLAIWSPARDSDHRAGPRRHEDQGGQPV